MHHRRLAVKTKAFPGEEPVRQAVPAGGPENAYSLPKNIAILMRKISIK